MQLVKMIKLSLDRKAMVGILLGTSMLLIYAGLYSSVSAACKLFALFLIIGVFRVNTEHRGVKAALYSMWLFCCTLALTLLPWYEMLGEETVYYMREYTPLSAIIINFLIVAIIILAVFAITARVRLSVILSSAALAFLVLVNTYVYRFKGKEMIFADVFATKTALNVVGNYNLALSKDACFGLCLLLLLLFAGFCLPGLEPVKKCRIKSRVAALLLSVAMSLALVFGTADKKIQLWSWDGTLINGYYFNYCLSIRDFFVKEPDGYSGQALELIEEEYPENNKLLPDSEELPNILVVMNESFADLSVVGSPINTNVPVTPFVDSLHDNCIKGRALSSVFGGTTANAEFEFLTGYSMRLLPMGAIPYQQYLFDDCPSLVRLLDSMGYYCMATHPYLESGWSRTAVYPRLGFERSTFIDDYPGEELVRGYISDNEMYEYLLGQLDGTQEPLFLFGVTMQNHGGYDSGAGSALASVELEGYAEAYPEAEEYLNLMRISDEALEKLISRLEDYPEDTLVLVFGDHLPKVENSFYEEVRGGTFDDLEAQMSKHTVPFFVWANFDIQEQEVGCTSLNYLGRYVLEAAGIELPPWYEFLKELETKVPAINALGYYSEDSGCFVDTEQPDTEEARWLEKYAYLQYNGIFDKGNRSDIFW